MGIRTRTVVLIAATGIFLLMLLLAGSVFVGTLVSNVIDRGEAVGALAQARSVMSYQSDELDSVAGDWAPWDDTYRFVRDGNKDYVESNLTDDTLENLSVDFMAFLDSSGRIVFFKAIDPDTRKDASPPPGIVRYLTGNPALLTRSDPGNSVSGLLALPEGTFALAARPITATDNNGSPDGTFVTGYLLNARRTADMRRLTEDPIVLLPPTAATAEISRTATARLESPTGGTTDIIAVAGADKLMGYSVVSGIDGRPGVVIGVTTPRTALAMTRSVMLSAGGALALIGVVLAALLAATLDKTILKRLSRLSAAASGIGHTRDSVARLPVSGHDEISRLASNVNGMLEEVSRSHDELEFLAAHDPLTQLHNRRHFEEELERTLAEYGRFGVPGAILWLDLDHFKDINDSLGHHAGDEVLARFAEQLRQQTRAYCTLARLGGDEFGVLMPGADRNEAVGAASRLVETLLATTFEPDDHLVRISTSVGISQFPEHGCTVKDLLTNADMAMYDAKAKGGNQLVVYQCDDSWRPELAKRIAMAETIMAALREDRFMLYAQPLKELAGGPHQNYELLLRMIGTDGKMVSPGEIIPTAERVGLIRDIDRWVARRAIDMLAEAESNGDHVLFSVNLSGTAFGDETLLRLMRDRFAATGARPDHLVVEITETTAIANIEAARRFILGLKEIGCRFALDDFGSGTSSFYYLKHLPIDFLKIDGSIVTGSSSSATDVHFLRAIVEMCKGLNVRTVAEYVEDEQLFDLISDEGVDFAQGFYVGRPQPLATYLKPGRPHLALPVPRLAFAAAALETQTA